MKFSNQIFSFLRSDNTLIESEEFNHSLFVNLLSVLSILYLGAYALQGILESGNTFSIGLKLLALALLMINLIFHNVSEQEKSTITGNILLTIISVYFLTDLFLGSIQGDGILWFSVYPVVALLSTRKKANLFAFLFLIIIILALWIPFPAINQTEASEFVKSIFFISYIANFLIIYLIIKSFHDSNTAKHQKIYQLQDEVRDKEEFISKVSHQIRTPLNNIVVVSNMLNPEELGDRAKDYFDTILASTNNLVDVVNSFSDITNVDIQERKKYEIRFDLGNTLQNTKNLFVDKESEEHGQPISIHSNIDYPLVGDPVKIKQIFLNLIEQILKHSRTKQIEINISQVNKDPENGTTNISFELSTMGLQHIDHDVRDKSQAGKAKKIIDKMELHIAKRTIDSLGGQLQIHPQSDSYIFHFALNFKLGQEEPEKELKTEGSQGPKKEKIDLKDANVLLVEDNLINQKIVVLSLEKAVKNIDVANNGKEALDKFGSARYDVILMDIQMPVMNGIVATKKIRSIEKSANTHTPIIAITANALLGDKEDCLSAGTDDYISKPFQIEILLEKMRNLL